MRHSFLVTTALIAGVLLSGAIANGQRGDSVTRARQLTPHQPLRLRPNWVRVDEELYDYANYSIPQPLEFSIPAPGRWARVVHTPARVELAIEGPRTIAYDSVAERGVEQRLLYPPGTYRVIPHVAADYSRLEPPPPARMTVELETYEGWIPDMFFPAFPNPEALEDGEFQFPVTSAGGNQDGAVFDERCRGFTSEQPSVVFETNQRWLIGATLAGFQGARAIAMMGSDGPILCGELYSEDGVRRDAPDEVTFSDDYLPAGRYGIWLITPEPNQTASGTITLSVTQGAGC